MRYIKHATTFKIVILCLLMLMFVSATAVTVEAQEQKALVVFLVRHAEKEAGGSDPALSKSGQQRAEQLANVVRDSAIAHVHSSNYLRTRSTAAPAAKQMDLPVQTYNPRDLKGMAAQLRATGGRHLVVGHSNTTPALVKLLGGEPGKPINEKGEYDRLYIVTIATDGSVSSILMRYGTPYGPTDD